MGKEAISFCWVRVGDGDPEPAAIEGEKPYRTATTFGCPDKFNVDDPNSGCAIVVCGADSDVPARYDEPYELDIESFSETLARYNGKELNQEDAARRERAYKLAIKQKPHSYAGFGRRQP